MKDFNIELDKKNKFKKITGEIIPNCIDYINNYLNNIDNGAKLIIGCDSQGYSNSTVFALTIIFYNEVLRNGAHVIYLRFKTPKMRDVSPRIIQESVYLYTLSEHITKNIENIKMEIHLDVNPEEFSQSSTGIHNNLSYYVYDQSVGFLKSTGQVIKTKPSAFIMASDKICKKKFKI